jgi:hypothetical protein
MASRRRTRAYRGQSRRTSGSGALLDTVRSTITQIAGRGGGAGRGRRGSRGGGNLAAQASGFLGGLMSGEGNRSRGSARGRRRRR